jgi:hypothetical protein
VFRVVEAEVFWDVFIENRTTDKVLFINKGQPVVCGTGLLHVTRPARRDQSASFTAAQFLTRFA